MRQIFFIAIRFFVLESILTLFLVSLPLSGYKNHLYDVNIINIKTKNKIMFRMIWMEGHYVGFDPMGGHNEGFDPRGVTHHSI